jgi:hypothetical protein
LVSLRNSNKVSFLKKISNKNKNKNNLKTMSISNKLKNFFSKAKDRLFFQFVEDWKELRSFFKKISSWFNLFCKHFNQLKFVQKLLYLLESKEFDFLENTRERVIASFNNFIKFCNENPTAKRVLGGFARGFELFYLPYDMAIAYLEKRGVISRP